MAYDGVLKDVRTCIDGGVPGRLPVFAISNEFDVRVMGGVYENYCTSADEMVRVQTGAVERFDYDWAYLQIDDCIEIEPLGVKVAGQGNILRATVGYLPADRETLARLWGHGFAREGRIPLYLEAIRRLKDRFGETVVVCSRIAAPFSTATLVWGISEVMMMTYDQPETLDSLIQFCTAYQLEFANAQAEAGADAVWLGDCNSSSHLVSPAVHRRFALEPATKITDRCRELGMLVINHNSEEKPEFIEIDIETHPDIINIGSDGDIFAIYEQVKGRQCISGNVNPITKLYRGTAEEVYAQARELVERLGRSGGYILCSGEMIPRDTPEENMRAMIRAAREW